jgi:cellulose synthase/poly-beta-1,6-N-acetylglucosamine synthase-like glycosyltransferase
MRGNVTHRLNKHLLQKLMENPVHPEGRSLSILIPVYNEANRIGPPLRTTETYVKRCSDFCEAIMVDDGSQDGIAHVMRSLAEARPWVRLLWNPINTGKGAGDEERFVPVIGAAKRRLP